MSGLHGWALAELPAREPGYTLDLDSFSLLHEDGQQEGVRVGYTRKGLKPCHQPIVAALAEVPQVAHFWLRPGNTACVLCVGLQRRLRQPQRAELTTLRWRLFCCAAVFSHAAGKPTLKLAVASEKRRLWWRVLFRQLSSPAACDAVALFAARAGPHRLLLPSTA